jgi:hypothetical protein
VRGGETTRDASSTLNLNGEQVPIKQSMLKVVNYEGVFDNLDEKLS